VPDSATNAVAAKAQPPAPAPPEASRPQPQTTPVPNRREGDAQSPQSAAQQAQTYKPPEPDITIKYGVKLGLPEDMSFPAQDEGKGGEAGDTRDGTAARLPATVIAEFRRHLRNCASL